MFTREEVIEQQVALGKEIAPDAFEDRDPARRTGAINGVHVYFTAEEETARDAEEKAVADERADYEANHKWKDDRRDAYGDIGDQLDMMFHDLADGSTTWQDHIAKVKADNPKP